MLVMNAYIAAGEVLRSTGGYSTSLRLIIALLGKSVLTCWITLWGIKVSGYVFLLNIPYTLWTEHLDCLDGSSLPMFLRWERKTCEVLIVVDGQTYFW